MKKYELTQEQINQLAEKKHAEELLQKFIPDAFEAKLEVGKWYISEHYLVYYLGNYNQCIQDMSQAIKIKKDANKYNLDLLGVAIFSLFAKKNSPNH